MVAKFKEVEINGYFAIFKQARINGYFASFKQANIKLMNICLLYNQDIRV